MTDTNQSEEQVLKVDASGRVRTPAKRRQSLLEEFDRSGVSGKQFAELAGIKYQTFATWLQKRKGQGKHPAKTDDTVKWLEAVVDQAQASGGKNQVTLVVELPGGARLEMSEVKQAPLVAALLRSLTQSC